MGYVNTKSTTLSAVPGVSLFNRVSELYCSQHTSKIWREKYMYYDRFIPVMPILVYHFSVSNWLSFIHVHGCMSVREREKVIKRRMQVIIEMNSNNIFLHVESNISSCLFGTWPKYPINMDKEQNNAYWFHWLPCIHLLSSEPT